MDFFNDISDSNWIYIFSWAFATDGSVSTGDTTACGQGAAGGANPRAVPAAGAGNVPLVQGPQITRLDGESPALGPRLKDSEFSVSLVQRSHTTTPHTQLLTTQRRCPRWRWRMDTLLLTLMSWLCFCFFTSFDWNSCEKIRTLYFGFSAIRKYDDDNDYQDQPISLVYY